MSRKLECSLCGKFNDRQPARYCRACHAAYCRENRKFWKLSPEAKMKARCRSHTHMLIKRGQIKREPCKECGDQKAEAHHICYPNPYALEWLCKPCHGAKHGKYISRIMVPQG